MRQLTIRRHHYRYYVLAALAGLVLLAGLASIKEVRAAEAARERGERLLTVYDRGQERVFLTTAATVGEALERADINIDETDTVEPAANEELIASDYNVNIYRARPVIVVDGATRQKIMTSRQTPSQIADSAGVELHKEDGTTLQKSENILIDGAGLELVIKRATPVTLVLYGKSAEIRTQAKTVGQLLKEKDITLSENDKVSTALDEPIATGMKVELWREGKQTITEEQDVAFATEKIQDADRPAGFREVKTPGVSGKRTVTFEIEIKNGQEVKRTEIASVTTKEPVKQIEVVGAKFNYTGGPLSDTQIQALGMCESGMTATRNSGNGFYGAFQFMPATWRSVAPAEYKGVLPHEAPLDAQKQAVQNLLSRSSIYTQFPGCAKKMSAQGIL